MSEEEDIMKKMNGLSIRRSYQYLPSYVYQDIEYLVKCYVNNITEFDFSANMDAMTNTTMEHVINWYQCYDVLCDLFQGYLEMTKNHVDDTLVHTNISYYIEQQQQSH